MHPQLGCFYIIQKTMKKRQLLALWLLCGVVLPLSTQAIENWIYEVEWWHHTIIWNDDRRWNIEITIASWIISDWYYRWFNENYKNSVWIGDWYTPGTWTYYSWDKMYGNTNTINNARWWGGDSAENWFSPNPTNFDERQWPCGSWWHVPSRWELNSLLISRCNINSWCNAWYSDETKEWISWDLKKAYDWTINNKLIYITWPIIWLDFVSFLNLEEYYYLWTSSPKSIEYEAYSLPLYGDGQDPRKSAGTSYRNDWPWVLCFKNHVIEPTIYYIVNFLNKGEHIRSGEIESWSTIPAEIISWHNLNWLIKTWYNFSWWAISGSEDMFDIENDVVTTWITLNAVWEIINYEIDYKLDGWINNENNVTWYTIETESITLLDPTKEWYNFSGWYLDTWFTNQITEITQWTTWDITLYAKWTKTETKPSWGSSGWGGRSNKTSSDSEKSTEWQAWSQQPLSPQQASDSSPNREQTVTPLIGGDGEARGGSTQNYTQEFQEAYEFAKEKWITTMPTIQEAQMNWKLTRIAMAKMLSQYAMNVLWQKPANIITPKFKDVTDKQNSDYDDWVTLAYQLWIMWQNMPNNKFRPNDEVTRAEFATALSRMLYHTSDGEYKSTPKYYIHHMEKLVKEWIITKDDPNMKELRWYVMIMLMRSAK